MSSARVFPAALVLCLTATAQEPPKTAPVTSVNGNAAMVVLTTGIPPIPVAASGAGSNTAEGATLTVPKVANLMPSQILPTSGRTIAGPGLFSRSTSGLSFLWNSTLNVNGKTALPVNACVTLVIVGDKPVDYSALGAIGGFGSVALPGDTVSYCLAEADRFTVECKQGPCAAVWRVDEVNVGKSALGM